MIFVTVTMAMKPTIRVGRRIVMIVILARVRHLIVYVLEYTVFCAATSQWWCSALWSNIFWNRIMYAAFIENV